jgi:hypothetical protein
MIANPDDLLLDFTARGNAAQFCASGWSTPEPAETWTLGPDSRLTLPAPTRQATYVMVFRLRPLAAPKLPAQRLRVLVNNVAVAEFTIDRRTIRTCLVPWAAIKLNSDVRITFQTPDAACPADLGLGDDRRQLGIAFTSILLYPDQYEHGQFDAFLSQEDEVPVDFALVMAAEKLPLHDLMLQFESLGQNCEFGLVQRQCQSEPLGLLRFSSTPLPQLLEALDARFDGMGSPNTIHVDLSSNGREYMVRDSRFGFLYHAWVNAGEMAPEDIVRRESRRVPFLVRKLVEDLEAGEKTFIFKGMSAMPEEEVFPLAMAIRRYGPNTLLFVTLSDADHKGGTVEAHAPGFLVGYVDRFAPGNNANDLLLGQWVKVCREAYRLRLAAGLTVPQPGK